ncbi:hypothetical protein BGZ83_010598 [Gryganskiella cystojenkinii]|nr:hypothetical protein BGZ83_010598 [Gryganskiella cystojenkinii]
MTASDWDLKIMTPELPHPWVGADYESGFPARYLSELRMRAASNAIREKPQWWQKLKDPVIADRWRQELVNSRIMRNNGDEEQEGVAGRLFPDDQIRFIFQELEWYAQLRQDQVDTGVEAPIERAIDGTLRSDGLVPEALKQRLLTCVGKLANVPDHLKDWHPGSNKQVLDLVHPSLFPAIRGRTRVTSQDAIPAFDFIGKGAFLLKDSRDSDIGTEYSSKTYQWLPTDFEISAEGKVKILSYINNLHPVEHADMYPVLEEIFELFVPMFEEVLAEMQEIYEKDDRITAEFQYPDHDPLHRERGLGQGWRPGGRYVFVAPDEFKAPESLPPFKLKATENPLQVIVKLANIELSPENPKYEGGTWHVEGMANENIVASGIYYYHSENVTETRLNFRISVREPEYQQYDYEGVRTMYGLVNNEPMIQHLDAIVTKQDRCIVFPNIYQHQVQPFELEDKTKAGSRKILVFFLVNPQSPILSTTHVPPQQMDWALSVGLLEEIKSRLPPELVKRVEDYLEWPMSLKEAKEHRLKLMEERKYFVKETNEEMFERLFSMCEH